MAFIIFSSGGRKVVLKPNRPSFCPKPLAGTTQMPLWSRRDNAYKVSGGRSFASAASIAACGSWILGKAYMAPSAGLHDIPSMGKHKIIQEAYDHFAFCWKPCGDIDRFPARSMCGTEDESASLCFALGIERFVGISANESFFARFPSEPRFRPEGVFFKRL